MILNMQWMRQNKVNILKKLPDFLAKDTNFLAVGDTCSTEHERIRLQLQDIFQQFFIETATWGLAYYEQVLNIISGVNDTYDIRRKRILLRYQSNQTSTKEFLKALAARYVSDDTAISLNEDNKKYSFSIVFKGGAVIDLSGLFNAISIYKPAHLASCFVFMREVDSSISIGSAGAVGTRLKIKPLLRYQPEIDTILVVGNVLHIAKKIIIQPNSFKFSIDNQYQYSGITQHIAKKSTVQVAKPSIKNDNSLGYIAMPISIGKKITITVQE